MPRIKIGECILGSFAISIYFLWFIVPTFFMTTLILVTNDTMVVFWTLIAGSVVVTMFACRLGFGLGKAIGFGCPSRMYTFEPWSIYDLFSIVHLSWSLPIFQSCLMITSYVWNKTIPVWLILIISLGIPIAFGLSIAIGFVTSRSYSDDHLDKKRIQVETDRLI